MSSMEIFIGRFEQADDQTIVPEDTDDFYDLENEHGCYYVMVEGTLYKFWEIGPELDTFGFTETIPAQDGPILLLYWYNGGAGIHEVAESAILKWVKSKN